MRRSFVAASSRHLFTSAPYRNRLIIRRFIRLFMLHLLALVARPFVRSIPAQTPPYRILVIKPDHLGDVLLATPALRAVRQQHPNTQIVALVGPWSAVMLKHNSDIDMVLTLPFPGFNRRATTGQRPSSRKWKPSAIGYRLSAIIHPYLTLLHYAMLLRAGRFDTALLLRDDHWWGAALALLAGIPRRVGYAVPECRPFLTTALTWDSHEHVTMQGLALARAMGDGRWAMGPASASLQLRYEPSPADTAWATDWLARHAVTPANRLIIIHPGTGGAAKHWLPERWITVANALAALPGVRILLTGGPGEEALVQRIAAHLDHPPVRLVGTASVSQLAALLGQATLVLGVDSGPLHIAVSQGTPTIHLFGPSDNKRFGPWGDPTRHVVLRSDIWCSPCGVFTGCPRHTDPPECMTHMTVAEVLAVAQQLLAITDEQTESSC